MNRVFTCDLLMIATILVLFSPFGMAVKSSSLPRPALIDGRPVLYAYDNPNIIILDADNFEHHVTQPSRDYILMVQFYLDWSEGSRKVVQVYSDLARNISTWENIIRLGAINCAEERNIAVCREYGYIAYPAFKLFPPFGIMKQSNSSIQLIDYNTVNRKIHKLTNIILEYIDKLSRDFKDQLNSWPDFSPIPVDTLNNLENIFTNQTKETAILLLLDRGNRDLNRMVLMDMSVYQANLIIRRIEASQQLRELFAKNTSSEPIFLYTLTSKDGKSHLKLISSNDIGGDNRELVTRYIETYFAFAIRIKRMDPIFIGDMYKGLRHSLYNEVTLHKSLNGSQIAALANYISIIYRYFPFDNENPRRFFKRMDQWIKIRRPDKPVESVDLLAIMRVGSEGFIPQTDHYHHCKSGYPCSLWLIFHTLTVSEYLKNTKSRPRETKRLPTTTETYNLTTNNTNIETTTTTMTTTINPNENDQKKHQVLYAMRDYVKYFYSCADCKSHFTALSSDLEDRLIHLNSSVITLWEVHNNISERLSREDPDHPRLPWPSRKTCPRCYTPVDNFISSEVFNFLLNHYSKERMVKLRNFGLQLSSNLSTSPVFLFSLILTLCKS